MLSFVPVLRLDSIPNFYTYTLFLSAPLPLRNRVMRGIEISPHVMWQPVRTLIRHHLSSMDISNILSLSMLISVV